LGGRCPRAGEPGHGAWYLALPKTTTQQALGQGRLRRGGYPSRTAAEKALAALLDPTLVRGEAGLRTSEWLKRWLEQSQERLRPTTLRGYRKHVEQYLVPLLGHWLLRELTPGQVERAFATIVREHEASGRPLTGATVHRIRATLRSALNSAVRAGLIKSNPASGIALPRAVAPRAVVWTGRRVAEWHHGEPRPTVAVWTAADTARFLTAIRGHRLYALYHLYAIRGLRRGEALGLHWDDMDLTHRTLQVRRQLQKQPGGVFEERALKTPAARREIALDRHTTRVLAEHRRAQQAEQQAAGDRWADADLVFTGPLGGPLSPDHVGHVFQALVTAHRMPPIRLHDLRHLAATLALNAGATLKTVQDQIGHASLTTTADLYASTLPETAQRAAEAAANLIKNAARAHTRATRHRPSIRPPRLRVRRDLRSHRRHRA
jgi:integrase